MDRALILAAGRSSRLGGVSKLLVNAAGLSVAAWHRRALEGFEVAAVIRPEDRGSIGICAPWISPLIEHPRTDGPVGALLAYLEAMPEEAGELLVLFADTLLPAAPAEPGDWVGVAPAPWRAWDYYLEGMGWSRGIPQIEVCAGVYRFSCRACLLRNARELVARAEGGELHMVELLRAYERDHLIQPLAVEGWQDAGDPEAISRVKPIGV